MNELKVPNNTMYSKETKFLMEEKKDIFISKVSVHRKIYQSPKQWRNF